MKTLPRLALAVAVLPLLVWHAAAQAPAAQDASVKLQRGETAVPGECLTRQELDLNAALAALKRPTRGVEHPDPDDALRFNPHYFVGTWNVEGVLPESPLGPAGDVTGVETVRHVERCTYESTFTGKSGNAAFTVKALMIYDPRAGYMVRRELDSRGFEVLKTGVMGGDPGGYFTHHWQAPPITHQKRRVWLRGTTFLASPENYRLRMQISEDGERFVNYGTIWSHRAGSAKP